MEKTVDYYMGLPYTVELEVDRVEYRASVRELPGCMATVKASESVGELWRLLKEDQRKRIEEILEFGDEVPEPSGATRDPFWENLENVFPDYDADDVRSMLYKSGAGTFPLRVLEGLWLRELEDVRLDQVKLSSEAPPKAEIDHLDQRAALRKGDIRPVRLGKSLKWAQIRLDGPRTKHGYRNIEVSDKPLRTEAAIVAALTVLEASMIEDFDFERLRKALIEYVEAHPELREKDLSWVLWRGLPQGWFSARKAENDRELKPLDEKLKELNRKQRENSIIPEEARERRKLSKYLPRPSWRWTRSPFLWKRSIMYMMALFAYRRPDFDDHTLREQIYLLDHHRKQINKFLEAQKSHMSFLEYGTPTGIPTRTVERAQEQVRAVVLADVAGLRHLDIANELGVEVDRDKYKGGMQTPEIADLVKDGRLLLEEALDEGGWQRKAEEMKADAERYNSLSEEDKEVETLAERMGRTVEDTRSLYRSNPELARFLAGTWEP